MGVTGLWKLIDQAGKPVPLETLENKVLAIDISIWLYQVTKGFQDANGASLPHAHLLGLFHRLCKLLFYRIKPIFVFDGGVPYLKRDTMIKRNQQRRQIRTEADRLQQRLIESLARERIVQQALADGSSKLKSPSKPILPEKEDMYKLPPLAADQSSSSIEASLNTTADSESSFDEKNSRQYYNVNLQSIDVTSKHFQTLPADVRHEILTDIKETRKESSWGRLHELPAQSDDFSEFQMRRLLKRRKVQQGLEDAEKEMGGKSLSLREIEALLKEEGVVSGETAAADNIGNRLAYNENTRYLHVRDLKRAIRDEAELNDRASVTVKEDDDSTTAVELHDEDLQRAIQMSLEECCVDVDGAGTAASSKDDRAKLRTEQKRLLGKAAKSLAKAYMVEYGGLNSDDVDELVEMPDDEDVSEQTFKYNDSIVLHGNDALSKAECVLIDDDDEPSPPKKAKPNEELNEDMQLAIQLSLQTDEAADSDAVSSNADSDFIDVPEWDNRDIEWPHTHFTDPLELGTNPPPSPDPSKSFGLSDLLLPVSKESTNSLFGGNLKETKLEVVIRPEEAVNLKDDMFADVFTTKSSANVFTADMVPLKEVVKARAVASTSGVTVSTTDVLNELKLQMDDIVKISVKTLAGPTQATAPKSEISQPLVGGKTALTDILSNLNKEMECLTNSILVTETKDVKPSEEVIEIDDEDDDTVKVFPPKKSKQSSLSSFIDVTVTPKKPSPEERSPESPHTPKVASPFFRKKTPSSKKKSPETVAGNASNVAKSLFPATEVVATQAVAASAPAKTSEDFVTAAASVLRTLKSTDELAELADTVQQESYDLRQERNKQDRFGSNITERMSLECKQLLRMFGVPYIVAPKEAEAQCAYLDAAKLTDGTITDDSDIWLFGGRTVYKHFFNQQKNVMEFRAETVERLYNVERHKMIQLAMLVGSDYTTGIHGIGTVTALEVLATFTSTPEKPGESTDIQSTLSGLSKFKEWWKNGRNSTNTLRKKLKNITISEDFPSRAVVDAYLYPEVENSDDKFNWGAPDAESIREFAKRTFGWTYLKTDETLQPVLRKLGEKRSQASIRNFFTSVGGHTGKEVTVSKRVRQAINKMSAGPSVEVDAEDKAGRSDVKKTRKPRAANTKNNAKLENGDVSDAKVPAKGRPKNPRVEPVASTSRDSVKTPKVPDFQPPIKQRQKAAEEMELHKQNAIRVFKEKNIKPKKTK